MNKSYRIVWNRVRNCLMVVSETTKSHGKGGVSKKAVLTAVTTAVAALGATQLAHAQTNWTSGDFLVNGSTSPNVTNGLVASGVSVDSLNVIAPGTISGGASNNGVYLRNSSLAGGITNSGTISGASLQGIVLDNSSLAGGIINSGSIGGRSFGARFYDSSLTGGITNTGLIQGNVGDSSTVGLSIRNSSISGGINNAAGGTISGGQNGIFVVGGTVTGGITNSGSIGGGNYGVYLGSASLAGGINNSGLIQGGANGTGLGIRNSSISDGITNSGTMSGIFIELSVVNGGITNSGLISGATNSISVASNSSLDRIVIAGNNTASFSGAVYAPNTPVTVAGGASYTLDTNFTTTNFVNEGTLNVRAADRPTITGDLTLGNTGTFSPTVTSQTNYSQVTVTGNVLLGGALAVNAANVTGTLIKGSTLTGVITGSAVTGTFATASDNSVLYNFIPVYGATQFSLAIEDDATTSIASATAATGNKAGAGAATALDSIAAAGGMSNVISAFGQMTSNQQISNAVSQTLPVLSGATTWNTMSVLSGINRIIGARHLQNKGISSGESFMGNNAVWMKPFGTWTDQANQNGAYGFKANTGGLMLGGDSAVSADTRIGAAVAWGNSYATSNAGVAPQNQTSNMYQFIGYGSYAIDQNLEANFQANGGWNNNTSNRQIGFMGTSAQGSYSSAVWHVGAGIGRPMDVTEHTKLIPSARFDYTWIKNQGYSETGASNGVGLNVNSETYQMSVLGVDGKVVHQLSDHNSVNANVGVGYNFSPTQTWVAASFQGAPSLQFTTNGVNPAAVMGRAGAGYTYKIRQDVDVGVRYDIDFQNTYTNQTASVKGRWLF